jgi:sRNA-binding regulator protein Hfq
MFPLPLRYQITNENENNVIIMNKVKQSLVDKHAHSYSVTERASTIISEYDAYKD